MNCETQEARKRAAGNVPFFDTDPHLFTGDYLSLTVSSVDGV